MNSRRGFGRAVLVLSVAGLLNLASCNKSKAPEAKPQPSAAPADKKIRLQAFPARVGDKRRASRKTDMKMSVEYWQDGEKFGAQDSARSEEYARQSEVLALVGGAAAEELVHYERYRFKEVKPDEPAREDNSLEGQSYIVDGREKETKATFAEGKPVAPEELERLSHLHADLAVEDKVVSDLKDKMIAVGAHATMREPLFNALVTAVQGEFKSGAITLSGTRDEGGREAAVFDWTAEMQTHEQNGMETTWHIKGQAVLGLSPAMVLRATMAADVDVGGQTRRNGARITMEGSGSMHDERTFTPL